MGPGGTPAGRHETASQNESSGPLYPALVGPVPLSAISLFHARLYTDPLYPFVPYPTPHGYTPTYPTPTHLTTSYPTPTHPLRPTPLRPTYPTPTYVPPLRPTVINLLSPEMAAQTAALQELPYFEAQGDIKRTSVPPEPDHRTLGKRFADGLVVVDMYAGQCCCRAVH